MTASTDLVVAYFQVTFGHAHLSRVRVLDSMPGLRCVPVQFAGRELTRGHGAFDSVRVLVPGVYEEVPRLRVVRSAVRLARELNAQAAVLDCPADFTQFATGRLLQLAGVATLVRWASTRDDYPRVAWKEKAKRLFYGGWDAYLTTGERASSYLQSFGVEGARAFRCGNPVEESRFEARRGELASEHRDAFLFVGRFIWHKNVERLLEAFSRYRALGGKFGLRFAGDGADAYAASVRASLVNRPGVTHLGFLGPEELAREYGRAACLVLPSLSENWGLVVNEALHARLPVIVSERCGCIPELVRHGQTGLVVDPLDVDELARAMVDIESIGPAGRAAMGDQGQTLVASQSLEHWARATADGIRAAVARRCG